MRVQLLSLFALSAFALPEPQADITNTWKLSVFQSANCKNTGGNITDMGMYPNGAHCSPPLEYYFASVRVAANAGGRCTVRFFDSTNGVNCGNVVASSPGTLKVGQCLNLNGGATTYGVQCT